MEKGLGLGLSSKGNWITRAIRLAKNKNEEVRSVEFGKYMKERKNSTMKSIKKND